MTRYGNYSGRVTPAAAPLPDDIQKAIAAVMRGAPPLVLFTTLARDRRLFFKLFDGGLLDRGNLTLRQREIVIARVTAACGAEYEWGVHVSAFAAAAELTEAQIDSLTAGKPEDDCWEPGDSALIRLCDSLHRDCDVDDGLWAELRAQHSDEAMMELLMLAGTYRMISYLVNVCGCRLKAVRAASWKGSEPIVGVADRHLDSVPP